jgi:hypothetical protein
MTTNRKLHVILLAELVLPLYDISAPVPRKVALQRGTYTFTI